MKDNISNAKLEKGDHYYLHYHMKLQYCKSFKMMLQFILIIIQCNDYNGQSSVFSMI